MTSTLQAAYNQVAATNNLLRAEVARLKARVLELEGENKRLNELQIPASRRLLNITKSALDDAEADIDRLQEQINRWQKAYDEAKSDSPM